MDLLITTAMVLSLVYFSVAGLMWVSSRKEIRKLEKEKDLEIQIMREKLKKLSEKSKRRRRNNYYRREKLREHAWKEKKDSSGH